MASIVRDGLRPSFVLILGSILGIAPGCGPKSTAVANPKDQTQWVQENSLDQLGNVLRVYAEAKGSAPATAADVASYEKAYPGGCAKVKNGEIVLFYGVPLEDGANDTILAYEKQAPESGGHVLMQDGKTIKKLTADEFKAAKKAGKGA